MPGQSQDKVKPKVKAFQLPALLPLFMDAFKQGPSKISMNWRHLEPTGLTDKQYRRRKKKLHQVKLSRRMNRT